jgi:hypothetical protein
MAKKPTPKKLPAKKPAVKKPAPAGKARPASKPVAKKPAPAKKPTAKPAPKPAAKAAPKPAAKPVSQPAPKAVAKPAAPKPAAAPPAAKPVAPPPPAPTAPPAPAVAKPAARNAPAALSVSVQTSAGAAAGGNTHAANLLVLVTCGGWPVTDLNQDHFTLMEHFEVPGQQSSFSNNLLTFRNAGSGAYLLQTRPNSGAPWRSGHHLGQLLVSSPDDRQGQAAFKLIIR